MGRWEMWGHIICWPTVIIFMMMCSYCIPQSISRLQLTAGQDSHIFVSQPWITQEEGYTTRIHGQAWYPRFTTGLPFPQAANGKNLEVCECLRMYVHRLPFSFFQLSQSSIVHRSMLTCISHENGMASRHGLWISMLKLWLASSWYIL